MSKATHEDYVNKYGRNIRIKGLGRFEDRLLTTDPVALGYVLNHPKLYEKPWQSRRVISRLIGEGMLAAEGPEHKRMRGVGNPAFSVQNMRAFVPITFKKAFELRDKWNSMIDQSNSKSTEEKEGMSNESKQLEAKLDVCHWISRATFDVIGLAGFDYSFSAIQHETNELFMAYKDMFEIAVSRGETLLDIAIVYFPWLEEYFPNEKTRTDQRSQEIINRVGTQIIKEKTRRVVEGEANGSEYKGIDFLTLLIKSNLAKNTPEHMRISDEELLANVNTFFFAGSDTTSLALTWILYHLAAHPKIQDRLRAELRAFTEAGHDIPSDPESPDWQNLWSGLDELPFLNNVIRETLRLIPPVHSSIRVAVEDGVIPTVDAIKMRDGSVQYGINIQEGQFIHVPIESMNVDKGVWGEDSWSFNPDRWDDLPDAVLDQPGLYNHTLSFSSGPRACIGMKFSVIEMKSFLHVLLTNFAFDRDEGERIFAANVVLTRPYVAGKFIEGSQCPLYVSRI
ncbi:cytochrome-450 hydroxylase [Fomitiporia mediterranea MF3/22]|uniref:cytochrome-450 hydroxylase n=1 Tax=Fomitiporia mediterranea (strain MF3/22) TaxID=694068 RepID=UPI0004409910|nr:cytochrome-450 hydroxylase [Fomitiporia mediterranea MF3/22]EJD02970.1 cytochrome-450 hydroxylase [Fomitiporia mediterranea MF3/22]